MGRIFAALACVGLAGCTTFPESPQQAIIEIRHVKRAIECELAAAAQSQDGEQRRFFRWTAATDLDVTLERNFSADGTVTVGIPTGLGRTSVIPRIGGANTDTRQSSLKFGTSIPEAIARNPDCRGDNPSETDMGLANWIRGSLATLSEDELVTISYVATFKIEVNGGLRFGYVLVPVVNPVDAGAGFSAYRNYTTRISIALTPPGPKPVIPRVIIANTPLLVRPVGPPLVQPNVVPPAPRPPAKDDTEMKIQRAPSATDAESSRAPSRAPASEAAPGRVPQKRQRKRDGYVPGSPRDRVINDPIILQQLLRNSPTFRQ